MLRTSETKRTFLASDAVAWAKQQLEELQNNDGYNTPSHPVYSVADAEDVSFVDWHIQYLWEHPQIGVVDYIANVRLKTRLGNRR